MIETEAAAIVRRIYQMSLDGYGTEQIADALTKDKILTPIYYWRAKGIKRPGKVSDRETYKWNTSTVGKILSMQEYCGDVVNFKTYSKSFKLKKRNQIFQLFQLQGLSWHLRKHTLYPC